VECVRLIRKYQEGSIYVVPINEISFYTYMAGSYGHWHPFRIQAGLRFKKQLVRAAIAAIDAIRAEDPDVRFITVDPIMIRRAKEPSNTSTKLLETLFEQVEFQTLDMMCGKKYPELGGKPEHLDIIGINHYPSSQEWIIDEDAGDTSSYETVDWEGPDWKSVVSLLGMVQERYGRPMIISETGSWGSNRPKWWRLFLGQIDEAMERGVDIRGVCAYPLIDRPDWSDGHLTNSGFWDFREGDPGLVRVPHDATIQVVADYSRKVERQKKESLSQASSQNKEMVPA
jgi:beta-glucosidase/6-phospho-beta-glucosidase/beta-galactosidase